MALKCLVLPLATPTSHQNTAADSVEAMEKIDLDPQSVDFNTDNPKSCGISHPVLASGHVIL